MGENYKDAHMSMRRMCSYEKKLWVNARMKGHTNITSFSTDTGRELKKEGELQKKKYLQERLGIQSVRLHGESGNKTKKINFIFSLMLVWVHFCDMGVSSLTVFDASICILLIRYLKWIVFWFDGLLRINKAPYVFLHFVTFSRSSMNKFWFYDPIQVPISPF